MTAPRTSGGRKAPRVSPTALNHITRVPGGEPLCGASRSARGASTTLAFWVQDHIDRRDPFWCRGCATEYVKHPQDHWPVPDVPGLLA